MDKEYIDKMNKDVTNLIKNKKDKITNYIKNASFLSDDKKEEFMDVSNWLRFILESPIIYMSYCKEKGLVYDSDKFINEIKALDIIKTRDMVNYPVVYKYDRYLDSEKIVFEGDVIITDPCYIIRKNNKRDDWGLCDCGNNMKALGFSHYMCRDTIYGDWGCTTYNADTGKEIGSFCADSGQVAVFLLDEVLNYNPDYDDHLNNKRLVTLIENFKGTVQFIIKKHEGIFEELGEKWKEYRLEVVGCGINKKTGETINFFSKQTSF